MSVDNDEKAGDSKLEDKYSRPIPASAGGEDDKRDEATIQRENFLNIYQENKDVDADEDSGAPDLSNGIRYRRDDEDEDQFEMRTSKENGKKPLIQELDAKEQATVQEKKVAREVAAAEFEKQFSFDTAERIDLKGSFIQQPDFVFYNIPAKGYNKETDVRYALSADEFIIEIRDKTQRGKHVIKRMCKTLTNSVDVGRSEVQLLVDFIVVKLCKETQTQWNDFGYDIANFTIPQTT